MKKLRYWTAQEDDWLRREYADRSNADLAQWLNRSVPAVSDRADKLGLRKSPEFAARQRRVGQFKKGNKPFNKGKPQCYWMCEESQRRSAKGRFKQGKARADNPSLRPSLYECVRKDKGRRYIYIKSPDGRRMMPKHRYVWEQAYGDIPKGYNIQFKDGDTLNCALDNLYLISRGHQLAENRRKLSPERKAEMIAKIQATRNAAIRRDRLRLKWGLEPEGRLVKRLTK